jgi:hypothetical protein
VQSPKIAVRVVCLSAAALHTRPLLVGFLSQNVTFSRIGSAQTLSNYLLCSTAMVAASVVLYKITISVKLLNAFRCSSAKLALSDVPLCELPVHSHVHSFSAS